MLREFHEIWWIWSDPEKQKFMWAGLRIAHFRKIDGPDGPVLYAIIQNEVDGSRFGLREWDMLQKVEGWRKIEQIAIPKTPPEPLDYPPGYEPPDGEFLPAYGNVAWDIMDRLPTAIVNKTYRYMLTGMIAQAIEDCVDQVLAGKPKQQDGKRRRLMSGLRCPHCQSVSAWKPGPAGGHSINIMCMQCEHWYNFTPIPGGTAIMEDLNQIGNRRPR